MNDATCKGAVDCQYNCYNMFDGGAGDTCANACPGVTGAKFTAYNNCNGTTCMTQCSCP
jgi:hypothetical protein